MTVNTGDFTEVKAVVSEDRLAVNMGSGDLRVLATPAVVALMENAAAKLASQALEDGLTTVGCEISVSHSSPTPINSEVTARATLTELDGRLFRFKVEAFDKAGLIAEGVHTRVSVKADKFQRKADEKFDQV